VAPPARGVGDSHDTFLIPERECEAQLEDEMVNPTDGTKVAPHGMFYMEGAGGCHPELDAPSSLAETHQPSCFGQEEEKGLSWEGAGATGRIINDARPTL